MSRPTKQRKNRNLTMLTLALMLCLTGFANFKALAGSNNFFGANASGTGSGNNSQSATDDENINAGLPGLTTPPAMPPAGDYTDDEKRMQRKYKGNIAHAKQLIAKGEAMMKSSSKEDKIYKKGKILKETGEKWLTDLKANDPYANDKLVTPEKTATSSSDSKQSSQKKAP